VSVLVDSDILIEVSRGRDREVLSRWTALGHSEDAILYSPVTAAELWAGARPREYDALTNLFRVLLCAPSTAKPAAGLATISGNIARATGVELGDALIAATAVLNEAALWTRNRKHYPMKELSFY
jgi:predicted nucleic acid-binding protein